MIVITGASGELGHQVVERLVFRMPPSEIGLAVRNFHRAERLSEYGVRLLISDYNDRASMVRAFEGADQVLLISGSEIGKRAAQHRTVIDAAKEAGVEHIVYTSLLHADTLSMAIAAEHRETEADLRASGVGFTILRNGWYSENCRNRLRIAAHRGWFVGSAGAGVVSTAPRGDYAEAAIAALSGRAERGRVYELAGDTGWTNDDLARELSRLTYRTIEYRALLQRLAAVRGRLSLCA
ncbi:MULTISPECIES: NAD(P)H-binding protein, partial [unclassified Sphingobium]|uniref:NAD(P)H-binding protein n=1 Tax=unclassified Sphingobium TaxID=2611147 RepID=UPI001918B87C